MADFPMHKLQAKANELTLGDAKVFHLADWHTMEHPARLALLRQIVLARGRDPRIAQKAVEIFRAKKVAPRDYEKQAAVLLEWVQNPKNVYYVNEPGERLQDPIYTIQVGYGDCFTAGTLVLKNDMSLVPVEQVQPGDEIWGYDRWSTVLNAWDKGELAYTKITLNNGSELTLTGGHKVYVLSCPGPKGDGSGHGPACACSPQRRNQCMARYKWTVERIAVSELREGMQLLQPSSITAGADTRTDEQRETSWLIGASIYRVGVRNPGQNQDRALRVSAIDRNAGSARCFDIATDDNYVYLPEADCTVSNCDDQILLLTCLFESVGLPWKFVLSGVDKTSGKKVRFIEGEPLPPGVKWSHIYCAVGTPPFNAKKWFFCETTVVGVPLGWDVISGDKRFIPEMDTSTKGKAPMIYGPKPPKPGFRPAALPPPSRRSPAYDMAYGSAFVSSSLGIGAGASIATSIADAQEGASAKKRRDDIIKGVAVGTAVSITTSLVQPLMMPIVESLWSGLVNGVMGPDYWQRLKNRNRGSK